MFFICSESEGRHEKGKWLKMCKGELGERAKKGCSLKVKLDHVKRKSMQRFSCSRWHP